MEHDLTEEERQMFMKFVTGKSKMNQGEYRFEVSFIGTDYSNPLPKTHTCYNTIDLPGYSNRAAMAKAFIVASKFCASIDDD